MFSKSFVAVAFVCVFIGVFELYFVLILLSPWYACNDLFDPIKPTTWLSIDGLIMLGSTGILVYNKPHFKEDGTLVNPRLVITELVMFVFQYVWFTLVMPTIFDDEKAQCLCSARYMVVFTWPMHFLLLQFYG